MNEQKQDIETLRKLILLQQVKYDINNNNNNAEFKQIFECIDRIAEAHNLKIVTNEQ
jgi:hypothetical protein